MSKGNLNDVEVSIDRSCGREKSAVFCAACTLVYLGNSHFFTIEPVAIEARENALLVVNRSHKGDRLR
jgi:hypothetical protein